MKDRGLSRGNRARVLLGATALAVALPAHAQTNEVEAQSGIEDIVVTARRASESLQDTPVAVTAFTPQQIENRSLVEVRDLAATTPTLTFSTPAYDSFSAYVSIRGQPTTDVLLATQPSVGIYLDGVYQATTLGAGLADLYDLERVEVLKGPQGTLYGRNSTGGAISLFTRTAELGERTLNLRLRGGKFGSYGAAAAVNLPLGDVAALRVAAQYSLRDDGYGLDLTNNEKLDRQTLKSLRGSFRFKPSDNLNIVLRADYSDGSAGGKLDRLRSINPNGLGAIVASVDYGLLAPAIGRRLASGSATPADFGAFLAVRDTAVARALSEASQERTVNYSAGIVQRQNVETWGVSSTLEWQLADWAQVKSITAYREIDRFFSADGVDASSFRVIDPGAGNFTRQNQITQELQLNGSGWEGRFNYAAGFYYFKSDGTEIQLPVFAPNVLGIVSVTDADVVNESYAGYLQTSLEIVENLRATAGVRYTEETVELTARNRTDLPNGMLIACNVPVVDRIAGRCEGRYPTSFNNWSYTFGLDYKITADTLIYARTGSGFKAGGINERGNASAGSFNAFAPEEVTDYEVGFKTDLFDRRLRFNLAAFFTKYTGLQQTTVVNDPATGAPISIVDNIDPVTKRPNAVDIKGVEIEVTAKPIEQLTLSGTFSYVDPQYKSGRPAANISGMLQGVAKTQASAAVTYEAPTSFGSLTVTGGWSYKSRVEYQPSNGLILPDGTRYGGALTGQDGFSLFDARIAVNFEEENLTLAVFGRNLTDKYYASGALDTNGAGLGLITQNIGAPRTIGAELNVRF